MFTGLLIRSFVFVFLVLIREFWRTWGPARKLFIFQCERFQRRPFVMPAKARIQLVAQIFWVPAFASIKEEDS